MQDSKNHIVGLTLSDTEASGNRRRAFIGHDKEGDADGNVVKQLGPTWSQ